MTITSGLHNILHTTAPPPATRLTAADREHLVAALGAASEALAAASQSASARNAATLAAQNVQQVMSDTVAAVTPVAVDAIRAQVAADADRAEAEADGIAADRAKLSVIDSTDEETLVHPFVDAEGQLLAAFNQQGQLDYVHPSETLRERVNYGQRVDDPSLDAYAALWVDADNKVLASLPVGFDGTTAAPVTDPHPAPQPGPSVPVWPLIKTSPVSVQLREMTLTKANLPISVIARGRTGQPDIPVNGDGLCHPKMVYVPGGWRGYKYWLALTPYFGVIGTTTASDAYENPHLVASNDLITWVEPSGGRIDAPEDGNTSFWSDVHLALGGDGYLHLWYRGSGFTYGPRFYVYRRSRDGVNWSPRQVFNIERQGDLSPMTANNFSVSAAFHQVDGVWNCYDVFRSGGAYTFPQATASSVDHVLRRNNTILGSEFGPYESSQLVNYSPRLWGNGVDPWHLDAIEVQGLYLHLVATGNDELYLAYSSDGWNFTVLPRLATAAYRSCIHVEQIEAGELTLGMVVGYRTGAFDYFTVKLEVR